MENRKQSLVVALKGKWQDTLTTNDNHDFLRLLASSDPDDVLVYFTSRREGLTGLEADERRSHTLAGPNLLSVRQPPRWWTLLLFSMLNPFNFLLLALAIIAVSTPGAPSWPNFTVLVVMIVFSCGVRFSQEIRGVKAAVRLQASNTSRMTVRRYKQEVKRTGYHLLTLSADQNLEREKQDVEGQADEMEGMEPGVEWRDHDVKVEDLVPGDIVLLAPGLSVPADCMMLHTNRLTVSQSSLTGESAPQNKSAEQAPLGDGVDEGAIFDIQNIAFMGTSVVSGTGLALVLATGDRVFMAGITEELNKRGPSTTFDRGLHHFSYLMIGFMIVMVVIVLVLRGTLSKDWGSAATYSLAISVGLVPEMLPAILNTNLARGSRQLTKEGAIVKTLGAVQNLGSISILCSDKTGTLTKEQITLDSAEDTQGNASDDVLQLAYTNAFYQSGTKNEIDAAILRGSHKNVLLPGDLVTEVPFDFERRRSSSIIKTAFGNQALLICKGAFEEVIALCTQSGQHDDVVEATNTLRNELLERVNTYNDEGYRVLAVATRLLPHNGATEESGPDLETGMVFKGLLKFLDPPRDDARDAITKLQQLGVEVKILTGDNTRIALQVCHSLNITSQDIESGRQAVTGPELSHMSPCDFNSTVRQASVLAKLTPSQKGDVIRSLKQAGHSVGMLGDGINDCIGLTLADVGISVQNAVDAAKQCADIILTEKRLDTVVGAIEIGRSVHGNTIKYIKMVASGNFGNVISILAASAWLPYQPSTPLQIVLQNLLYDLSQTAIPWDTMDEEYLAVPHDWDVWDTLRFILCLGPTSSVIDVSTFCISWFYYGVRSADDGAGVAMVQSHWFLQGLLTQVLIVHVIRTARVPFVGGFASTPLVIATGAIMAIGFAVPFIPPLARVLGMGQPSGEFVGFLVAELVVYCFLVQAVKMVYIRLTGRWL